ncbi:FAST kinase domain-containing protein 4 [Pygocentrus nattereri]|uniref:FAST kinase domain-containing protein 4 n=1 Tax=Pygocentrus nattereri TaxID=42514 RepID=A0A3B4BY38_PYGNA|nr:FAST kinase domain-containing protein 4 [Pygocentrus nattereri]XP_037390138.1 FAST kinase domain-containing protein 4 [Pygocentrus nattereri]
MTTRLLGRWARLLSRCPQASASAAHLQGPTAQPAQPLRSQVQIRSAVRPLCLGHGRAQEEEPNVTFKRTKLDVLVEKATSPQEVLQAWEDLGGSPNQAASCLSQLSRLVVGKGGADSADVLQDPRCVDLLETVNSQVSVIWNGTLVSLLRSLSNLGLTPSATVLRSLQTEALWRLRRLTYRQLSYLVDWASSRHSQGQGDEALTAAVLKQLELRWTELSDPRTVSTLMGRAAQLSPFLMDKLEDKALELAEKFSAEDIRKVALALASQGRRAVPLLRALSYHLHQKPSSELKTPLLLDIAFAYGKLNFHQTQVFQRMAAELLPRLPEMSSTDVTRCSKSLAFLKWLHLPLFEGFAQHFQSNSEKYSTLQLCNLLMSFAKLNFQPSNREEFYRRVHEALEGSWQGLEPFLLADVVWSLCVLQQAKPEFIAALTDPDFQTKLSGGSPVRTENYRLKLLHIAASGQLESLGALGVHPTIHLPTIQVKAPSLTSLQSGLHTALQSLTSSCTTALRTDVNTVYGWTIDAELVVDSENKPISLEKLVAPHLPGGGGSEQLPQGAHRLAFLAWEFPHFGSRSKDLLGRFAMQKRHLQLAGFLVVEVPYFEWLELKSDWQKEAYLKDKMGKAIAEDMAK